MKLWYLCVLCVVVHASVFDALPKDLGLQINESLRGYFTQGTLPFQLAYDEGKAANRSWTFSCSITIEHMKAFVTDPTHTAQCYGKIFVDDLTPVGGTEINGGIMQLFPGDLNDHQLQLVYTLPFTALGGVQYTLQGVKHIDGNKCLDLYQMFTTAYTTLFDGTVQSGRALSTGVVIVPFSELGPFVRSARILGNGTDADKLDVAFEFTQLLLKDVAGDCLNSSNWASQFWYVWTSDGTNGMLLDLIERPQELELRLETFAAGVKPTVSKRYLKLEELHQFGPDNVTMGPVTLSPTGVRGLVDAVALDLSYDVMNGSNHFVPENLRNLSQGLLPDIYSRYGAILAGSVGGHRYAAGVPLTFTTYTFKLGLKWARWAMISAMNWVLAGTRTPAALRVEVVAMVLTANDTLATSYVALNGREFHLNESFADTTMTAIGALDANDTRWFGAEIRTAGLQLDVTCSAPAKQFALLEQELLTEIHTTVLGDCRATERLTQQQYECKGCALLEKKDYGI